MLTRPEIQSLRMRALRLHGERFASVGDAVTWFGAMQAQDLSSGLWSLGMRLQAADATAGPPGSVTQAVVESALERREALRTWPMRGTVHLVPSADARWMLTLMGVKPLRDAARRRAFLGIDEDTVTRSNAALVEALAGGGRLTRAACLEAVAAAGIEAPGQVGYHLLWYASQVGLTCIAPNVGKEQTFVLLDEWAPHQRDLGHEEALAEIARRYVRSHGPVNVKDLARWTGLGVRDCRAGVVGAGEDVVEVATEDGPMLVSGDVAASLAGGVAPAGGWVIPPGFDEYMLGYGDRSAFLDDGHLDAVVPGSNGVFRATLVRAGRVVGTWKRSLKATRCVVEVEPLVRLGTRERAAAQKAFEPYGEFVGLPVEVSWGS
ncbi:winged helix DNA-binding domain-containing protein [Demequina sp. NBRC 110051]|uniref:winged helix DNA-binding domain-containing protein n=1 Tax=Demequina sp. NBRC 110051 TaxID=1570340 RepID=UPI00117CCDA5|nr:winged helix DNA-binding domain-containing protein [Demequina sp. NBRC 110051]